MLYFGRTEYSEGTDANKTNESKEYNICHYWYYLDKGFSFQTSVWNSYHDLLMISINLEDIAILNIPDVDSIALLSELAKVKL